MSLQLFSHAEQVATHLRAELLRGRWIAALPGTQRLGKELGVNHNTVEAALRLLEQEGLLVAQGHGRRRKIVIPQGAVKARSLRVKILLYDGDDAGLLHNVELLARLQEAGFAADYATKSLHDLGMDANKVARFVSKYSVDAWVISAGPREVLEWFANQPVPALAMFGRFTGLPIAAASPRKSPAMVSAVRKLVALGHRRIVMLTREERRKPHPALFEQNFLNELVAQGLTVGPYNLPDWDDHPAGFQACLDSLFQHTPPSALIIEDTALFLATHQYLARHGIMIPEQVSLLCADPDPAYTWCQPTIAHLTWDYRPVVKRALRWADNVARGREDRRQTFIKAEFVEGGTIGPAVVE